MLLRDRMKYAEKQLEEGRITHVDQYMAIVKGTYEDKIEDKINALTQYLFERRVYLANLDNVLTSKED